MFAKIYPYANPSSAASESVVFMLLDAENVTAEEVDASMAEVATEDVEEEVDKVE